MKNLTATVEMADAIHNILHTTIRTVYPKYYPIEVADFFCQHHSREHILEGIASGNMGVLIDGDIIIGTGCYDGNHITGVYVLPDYQKQGCGSRIMDFLEMKYMIMHTSLIWKQLLGVVMMANTRIGKPHGQHLNGARKAILFFLCTPKLQIIKLAN